MRSLDLECLVVATIEEVLDDDDNISQFEPEKTLNKSWFEREFVKKLEN